MSWYSDKEKYNERPDPPYCKLCKRMDVTADICNRCVKRHEEEEEGANDE